MSDRSIDRIPEGVFEVSPKEKALLERLASAALDTAELKVESLGLLQIARDFAVQHSERYPRIELFIPEHRNKHPRGMERMTPEIRLRVSMDPVLVYPNLPLDEHSPWKDRYVEIRWRHSASDRLLFPKGRDVVEVHASATGDGEDVITDAFGIKTRKFFQTEEPQRKRVFFGEKRPNISDGVSEALRQSVEKSEVVFRGTQGSAPDSLKSTTTGSTSIRRLLPLHVNRQR